MQMGVADSGKNDNMSVSGTSTLKKKKDNFGPMNAEEIRLNKQLLKEISKRKKEKNLQSELSIMS